MGDGWRSIATFDRATPLPAGELLLASGPVTGLVSGGILPAAATLAADFW